MSGKRSYIIKKFLFGELVDEGEAYEKNGRYFVKWKISKKTERIGKRIFKEIQNSGYTKC